MKVSEFWKQHVNGRGVDGFDREEFVSSLTVSVPDWREEIRNEDIWPELHSQGSNINEVAYTKIFIDELGLEYAFFLIRDQWGKRHHDASCALEYCVRYIITDWDKYPDFVREKILSCKLKDFLLVCVNNPWLWNQLSETEKCGVVWTAISEEKNYVMDVMMFNVWKNELSFKETPYVLFMTDEMKSMAREFSACQEKDRMVLSRMIRRLSRNWNIPRLMWSMFPDDTVQYCKSGKISCLQAVTGIAKDRKYNQLLSKHVGMLELMLGQISFDDGSIIHNRRDEVVQEGESE